MTDLTGVSAIPSPAERAARNAALHADNIETGFFDEQGRPAPWPEDINDWAPATYEPRIPEPGQPPY